MPFPIDRPSFPAVSRAFQAFAARSGNLLLNSVNCVNLPQGKAAVTEPYGIRASPFAPIGVAFRVPCP